MSKNTPIILIKIGGSLITDKAKPFTVRQKALDIIASEIKKSSTSGKQLIIGHGAGSFAHVPAKKYQTHKGYSSDKSREGIVQVVSAVGKLNRLVMESLLKADVEAVPVSPLSSMSSKNHQLESISTDTVEGLLGLGIVPVVYGDVILDKEIGCTIFSTEKVLGYLGLALQSTGHKIEKIIHCGQTDGVYDSDGKTIPLITTQNFSQYKETLGGSSGVDVTGGMLHKVEETLTLATKGIPGLIIDGIENGSLSAAIVGEEVVGTKVGN